MGSGGGGMGARPSLADMSQVEFDALVAAALARVTNTTSALHLTERRREELMLEQEQAKVRVYVHACVRERESARV